MALLQLTVIPMGESISVGDHVAAIQRRLSEEGVVFRLHDMGTIIEGEPQELFLLLSKIYEEPFAAGAVRVVTNITIDDRRDKAVTLGDKTDSVERRLRS